MAYNRRRNIAPQEFINAATGLGMKTRETVRPISQPLGKSFLPTLLNWFEVEVL